MSKERELLRKLFESGMLDRLLAIEVGQLLAQPEQESIEDRIARWHKLGYEQGRKASKREPLSDEAVIARYKAISIENAFYVPTYYAGFRDAEKAYGITGVGDE